MRWLKSAAASALAFKDDYIAVWQEVIAALDPFEAAAVDDKAEDLASIGAWFMTDI